MSGKFTGLAVSLFVAFIMAYRGIRVFAQVPCINGRTCQSFKCDNSNEDCKGQGAGASCNFCNVGGDGTVNLCVRATGTCPSPTTTDTYCGYRLKGHCDGKGHCVDAAIDETEVSVDLPGGGGTIIIHTLTGCNLIGC
jgi:hypothetical protein